MPINANLYHYAGNNPVRFIDPNGTDVTNKTDKYIVVRLEEEVTIQVNGKDVDIDTVIVAPGETIKGKFDGAKDLDGNYYKITARNSTIDFEVKKDAMRICWGSKFINCLGDLYKKFKDRNLPANEKRILSGYKKSGSEDAKRLSEAWDKTIIRDLKLKVDNSDFTNDKLEFLYDSEEQKQLRIYLDPKQFKKEEKTNEE